MYLLWTFSVINVSGSTLTLSLGWALKSKLNMAALNVPWYRLSGVEAIFQVSFENKNKTDIYSTTRVNHYVHITLLYIISHLCPGAKPGVEKPPGKLWHGFNLKLWIYLLARAFITVGQLVKRTHVSNKNTPRWCNSYWHNVGVRWHFNSSHAFIRLSVPVWPDIKVLGITYLLMLSNIWPGYWRDEGDLAHPW